MLSIGQVLQERYHIIAVLGQGGMGAVYRAHDNRLNATCTVKEMIVSAETISNPTDAAEQFKREATVLAMLRHPNLPRVIDYFISQSNCYLVMDFIEGQNLQRVIEQHVLPETTVLDYANQLLNVLEYIHGQGVVHRDIKPANIIVQPNGRIVLVDFGLVKVSGTDGDTGTKTFLRGIGTPEFAPLEQIKGGTDQRSDLYSLGATLYNALTGRTPIDATDRAMGVYMPDIRELNPAISTQTERVVQKALALNPEMRYPTAAAMSVELNLVAPRIEPSPNVRTTLPLETSTIPSSVPGTKRVSVLLPKRLRALVAVAAVAVGLTLLGFLLYALVNPPGKDTQLTPAAHVVTIAAQPSEVIQGSPQSVANSAPSVTPLGTDAILPTQTFGEAVAASTPVAPEQSPTVLQATVTSMPVLETSNCITRAIISDDWQRASNAILKPDAIGIVGTKFPIASKDSLAALLQLPELRAPFTINVVARSQKWSDGNEMWACFSKSSAPRPWRHVRT